MSKKKFSRDEYVQALLDCPECGSDYVHEDGNNEESAVSCGDCGFEVVTNNVAKSKNKWNKINRGESDE